MDPDLGDQFVQLLDRDERKIIQEYYDIQDVKHQVGQWIIEGQNKVDILLCAQKTLAS